MLSGIFPFLNPNKVQTKRNIVTGKLNFSLPQWAKVTNDGKDLVVRMLKPDLKKRLTLGEIL
jgi:serine/threonine protein kinase